MKIVLGLIVGFLATLPGAACADQHALVRGMIWGASRDDVKDFESATFWDETPDTMRFFEGGEDESIRGLLAAGGREAQIIDNYRRTITYTFDDGKLFRMRYDYADLAPANPRTALDLYAKEAAALTALYGKPASEKAVWKRRTYRNYPEFWPRALGSGDVAFITEWRPADTVVILRCAVDDGFYRLYSIAEKAGKEKRAEDMTGILGPVEGDKSGGTGMTEKP